MEKLEWERVEHALGPCCDKDCRILILGTMPSPKSREQGFYYGHPQNAFWSTLAQVLGKAEPRATPEARRAFALENHIALWDVLASCDIVGADDSSIRNERPNDLNEVFRVAPQIRAVFVTGKKAKAIYEKYREEMYAGCEDEMGWEAVYLPSTSPANRAMQGKELYWELWAKVAEALRTGT